MYLFEIIAYSALKCTLTVFYMKSGNYYTDELTSNVRFAENINVRSSKFDNGVFILSFY